VPDHDCAVYEKLTEAGAVLMGKAGLQEFAYGITCNNPHFGAIRNPRDPERIPGGSSGGSGAAVAAGMVFFRHGQRHGRVDPDSGGVLRMLRAEADFGPRQPSRCDAARFQSRSHGAADAHPARRRPGVECDCGL